MADGNFYISTGDSSTISGTITAGMTMDSGTLVMSGVDGYYYPLPTYLQQEKGESKMRNLYTVYIIDSEDDSIVYDEDFVAANETEAQMKAVQNCQDLTKDLSEYDFVIDLRGRAGAIRAKKAIQEVKIVGS